MPSVEIIGILGFILVFLAMIVKLSTIKGNIMMRIIKIVRLVIIVV